jgi:hypothetical protein
MVREAFSRLHETVVDADVIEPLLRDTARGRHH